MTPDPLTLDLDPMPGASPSDQLVSRLELFGYRPSPDEPDPRPVPEDERLQMAAEDIVDVLTTMLTGTRSEPDLDDLLWGAVNLFHRSVDRVQRLLDANTDAHARARAIRTAPRFARSNSNACSPKVKS